MKLTEGLVQDLKNKKIRFEDLDLNYFFNFKARNILSIEADNILKLLNNNLCSFSRLIDKLKNNDGLSRLLSSPKIFKELLKNNTLTKEDLKYLLNEIEESYETHYLCRNSLLIKHILKEFVLDKKLANKLNKLLKKDNWYERANIYDITDLINFEEVFYRDLDDLIKKDEKDIDQELLKLNELNRYAYAFSFSRDQRIELSEILNESEKSLNTIKQIIDNHLEYQYDFETLKKLLSKDDKKKKIKMNF